MLVYQNNDLFRICLIIINFTTITNPDVTLGCTSCFEKLEEIGQYNFTPKPNCPRIEWDHFQKEKNIIKKHPPTYFKKHFFSGANCWFFRLLCFRVFIRSWTKHQHQRGDPLRVFSGKVHKLPPPWSRPASALRGGSKNTCRWCHKGAIAISYHIQPQNFHIFPR